MRRKIAKLIEGSIAWSGLILMSGDSLLLAAGGFCVFVLGMCLFSKSVDAEKEKVYD